MHLEMTRSVETADAFTILRGGTVCGTARVDGMVGASEHLRQLNIYSQAHVLRGAPRDCGVRVCNVMFCVRARRRSRESVLCVCVVSHDNVWVGGA